MAKLIWTEPSLRQIEEIIDYIALDKPLAAKRVAKSIFEITENVEDFKLLSCLVPEFPVPNYSQIWISPCWIYYKVAQGDIYILHIKRAESVFRVEYLDQ